MFTFSETPLRSWCKYILIEEAFDGQFALTYFICYILCFARDCVCLYCVFPRLLKVNISCCFPFYLLHFNFNFSIFYFPLLCYVLLSAIYYIFYL